MKAIMLNRLVKQIYPSPKNIDEPKLLHFSETLDNPNIILLGDPGAGKSFLFEKANQFEKGVLQSARNFLIYGDSLDSNQTVYIDALDEKRSIDNDYQTIDSIAKMLNKIKPSKLRISCRIADWLGETDIEVLKPFFKLNGGYIVLALQPLSIAEMDFILEHKKVERPSEFRKEAALRGVEFLLTNPQTLIMLIDSVDGDEWPSTKKELYQKATELLLTEHNPNHSQIGINSYSMVDIREATGAVCASLLISDTNEISLFKKPSKEKIPSFLDIPNIDSEIVLSALAKKAFISIDPDAGIVQYKHRTIAEYLGAYWIARSIKNGLPLSRILSLICIDGYPAPELRGLYAWLVNFLPEQAELLIAKDPYGVLTYGDCGSLSFFNRKALLDSLVVLSEKDPWFHSEESIHMSLGSLSGPDMVEGFRTVLSSNKKKHHLRSIVLNAIENGPVLSDLKEDLVSLYCDESAYFRERYHACKSIIKVIPDGIVLIIGLTRSLNSTESNVRLKIEIISKFYNDYFEPQDLIRAVADYIKFQQKDVGYGLWTLRESIKGKDLPYILDGLSGLKYEETTEGHSEVERLYHTILERCLKKELNIAPKRVWKWLSGLKKFHRYNYNIEKYQDIRDWLTKNEKIVTSMFQLLLTDWKDTFTYHGKFWDTFSSTVLHIYNRKDIIRTGFSFIKNESLCDEAIQSIFSLLLNLTKNLDPPDTELFEKLIKFGNSYEELSEVLFDGCTCRVDNWRQEEHDRRIKNKKEKIIRKKKNTKAFQKDIKLIKSGLDLGWLAWLGQIYYSHFADVNDKISPKERLIEQIGEENCQIALEGFRAVIHRTDLPTPEVVAGLSVLNQYLPWWYSIVAGLTEAFLLKPDLRYYNEKILKAALAIDLFFLQNSEPEPYWKKKIYEINTELILSVYSDVIMIQLTAKKKYINGLYTFCDEERLSAIRGDTLVEILRKFPNTNSNDLRRMLQAAIISIPKEKLLELTNEILQSNAKVRLEQRALWFAIGFLLDFSSYKEKIKKYSRNRDFVLWEIRSLIVNIPNVDGEEPAKLKVDQIVFLSNLFAAKFPNADYPIGGWSGDRNPWDASNFINNYINELSARTEPSATIALEGMLKESIYLTYKNHLLHSLSNHRTLCRQKQFIQANWACTIEALAGGHPAHVQDLHAITLEYLENINNEIKYGNTDIFKVFWNEDQYSRITKPKVEESCRDRLIDLLKPYFNPLSVRVEPEGHMAIDKRADIVLFPPPGKKLPLELKRDTHDDLWYACENQLDRLYTRDPEAEGYGIYIVFWFGDKRNGPLPKPPRGIRKPLTSKDLQNSLQSLINPEHLYRLRVFVLDVSPPEG